MKYSEMIKFLNDNGILLMQAVIANEVDNQLSKSISESEFEDVCDTIFKTYLECVLDPDLDIWYLVDDELTKRGYKEVL